MAVENSKNSQKIFRNANKEEGPLVSHWSLVLTHQQERDYGGKNIQSI